MDTSSKEIETSDELIIVNRSKTYHVSKKMACSSIPYFEKMFCCDLLESRENKVTLDFDEEAFQLILNAVFSRSYVLRIENVLHLSKVADYLMIDQFQEEFLQFFRKKFTIRFIPNVLLSVNEFSKPIDSRMVNAFIEAHFLKIVNTIVFLKYPIETVHHILRLNLHIDSELQVFKAIKKWLKNNSIFAQYCQLQLLKCIRWCHLDKDDMEEIKEDDLIKYVFKLGSIICQPDSCKGDCAKRRAKPKSLIVVLEVENVGIDLLIIDENYSVISTDHFVQCDSLRPNLIADENITDIIYDSGRKGICVDWKQKKFRYLKMFGSDDTYYGQLYRYIMCFKLIESRKKLYLEEEVTKVPDSVDLRNKSAFLEFGGRFHACGYTKDKRLYAVSPVHRRSWYINNWEWEPALHSCLADEKIFVITKEGVKRIIDLNDIDENLDIELSEDQEFQFDNLQLTSLDWRFYLLDKLSMTIYIFDDLNENWKEFLTISSPHSSITLTAAYLPDERAKTLFKVTQTV